MEKNRLGKWIFRLWMLGALVLAWYVGSNELALTGISGVDDTYHGFAIAMGCVTFLVAMVAYFMVTALISVIRNLGTE